LSNHYTVATDDPIRAKALISLAALGENPTSDGLDAILYFLDGLGITPYRSDDKLPKDKQDMLHDRISEFFSEITQGEAISFAGRLKRYAEGINFMLTKFQDGKP
jgi:hypothetical protein